MTLTRITSRALTLCVFILFGRAAIADVLIDNLAEPVRSTTEVSGGLWASQGFGTDDQAYTLDSITVIAGMLDGEANPVAELRVGTPDGHPDTSAEGLLTTLTVPDLTGDLGERTLTPDQSVLLLANTRYFLILGAAGNGTFGWTYANSNTWLGNGHFANYEYSDDMGATWTDFGNDFPYFMRVEATPYTASETVNPLSFTVISGFEFAGDLTSLYASDDDCLGIFPDEISLVAEVQFDSLTTILSPSELTFNIEASVGREGLSQEVLLFDYDTSTWVSIDGRVAPIEDTLVSVTFFGEATALVGPSGELTALIRWLPINDEDPAQDGWNHCIDLVSWEVTD